MSFSIAIDGPAGAGKSTIAKMVSIKKGFLYIDTGAMYRTCALKALRNGISVTDNEKIEKMLYNTKIYFEDNENKNPKIMLDGEDVSDLIRTPQISKAASDISALKSVREKMVFLQRQIANNRDVVLDGRDIGSYVLPNATLKIFLTASIDERARRRFNEMTDKDITFEEVKKDIQYRDYNDSHRKIAPLIKAEDAILLDTTDLEIDESVDKVLALVNEACLEK